MAQQREARTPTTRGKRLDHLRIRETVNGVVVEHHFAEDGMAFHKPKEYEFGPDEQSDLVQHLVKYLHVPVAAETAEEGGE